MIVSHTKVERVKFKKSLPALKDQAHYYFDMLWIYKYITREEAYIWLAKQLGVEEPQAHMSKMNEEMCRQVIESAIQVLNDMRRLDLDFGAPIRHPYYEINTFKSF